MPAKAEPDARVDRAGRVVARREPDQPAASGEVALDQGAAQGGRHAAPPVGGPGGHAGQLGGFLRRHQAARAGRFAFQEGQDRPVAARAELFQELLLHPSLGPFRRLESERLPLDLVVGCQLVRSPRQADSGRTDAPAARRGTKSAASQSMKGWRAWRWRP